MVCHWPQIMSCLHNLAQDKPKPKMTDDALEAFPVAPVVSFQSDLDQRGPKVVGTLEPFIGKGGRVCGLPPTAVKDGKGEGEQTRELQCLLVTAGSEASAAGRRRAESLVSSIGWCCSFAEATAQPAALVYVWLLDAQTRAVSCSPQDLATSEICGLVSRIVCCVWWPQKATKIRNGAGYFQLLDPLSQMALPPNPSSSPCRFTAPPSCWGAQRKAVVSLHLTTG